MPVEVQEVRNITNQFMEKWWEQQAATLQDLAPLTHIQEQLDAAIPMLDVNQWLHIALYGQHHVYSTPDRMQPLVEKVARQIFQMPDYEKLCVPYWWKSEHPFGRLWNDAYVRAHRDELVSLSRAVEILAERKGKYTLTQLTGHLDRETIEAWMDPDPPPKRRTARLVRQDQLDLIP